MLHTPDLLLRPLSLTDLETTHSYASCRENALYMCYLPNDTLEETRRFLEEVSREWQKSAPEFYEFAVLLQGRHIGAVSVYLHNRREEGELGWIIHRDYWQRGYATQAAMAVRDFSLNTLHVHRLTAHCDARNAGSQRVMQRLGMTYCGDGWRVNRACPDTRARELTYVLEKEAARP